MEGMGVRDKKERDKKERESMVSKMEEGEWGGETGRRLHQQVARKKRGRDDKAGLKSDLAPPVQLGVKPGMTQRPIAPKDKAPTG